MEKRSRRRIRDLVALTAIQGFSQNEIGCARISMMARSRSAPFKGRIQKRKTNHLQIIISTFERTAGPYKSANNGSDRLYVAYFAGRRMLARSVPTTILPVKPLASTALR